VLTRVNLWPGFGLNSEGRAVVAPTDPTGLPEATRPELLELADGDTFDLRIGAVAKRLGDITVRMLGYNCKAA
jgi:hypothetical protein